MANTFYRLTDNLDQWIVWEDLRFPATAINPPGLASDPGFDTTNGGFLFDAASTELIFLIEQLPPSYSTGSNLKPHVHWQKTTSASGTVLWRLEYKIAIKGEVMDAAFTQLDAYETVSATPDDDTTDRHLITAFDEIDGTNLGISDMLLIKLSRIGGDGTYDTYGADARLLEFDFHYQRNSPGSNEEFIK